MASSYQQGIYNAIPYLQAADVRQGLPGAQAPGGMWNVQGGQSVLDRLRAQIMSRFGNESGHLGLPEWIARSKGGAQMPGQMALQSIRASAPTIENIAYGSGGLGRVPSLGYAFPNIPGGGAGAASTAARFGGISPGIMAAAEGAAPAAASWGARLMPALRAMPIATTPLRALGTGSLWGLGGQFAGSMAIKAGAPQWTGNALAGAGLGAGIGSMVAPGLGTAIGAGVGGLAGAGLGLVGVNLAGGGGGPSVNDDDRKMAQNMIKKLDRMDPAAAQAARLSFKVAKSQGGDKEATTIQSLLAQLPQSIGLARANKAQGLTSTGAPNPKAQLMQQMMVGQMMAEQAARTQSLGQVQADYIRGLAPQLPESFRGMAEWDAATRLRDAQMMGNAFTGSVLAKPVFDVYQNQLNQYAQLMQQSQAKGSTQSLGQMLATQAAA